MYMQNNAFLITGMEISFKHSTRAIEVQNTLCSSGKSMISRKHLHFAMKLMSLQIWARLVP